jgi:hypothetical protein
MPDDNNNDTDTKFNDISHQQSISAQSSSGSSSSSSSEFHFNCIKKEKPLEDTSAPSACMTVCFRVMQRNRATFPYLQIGGGSQRYTFVFRLVEATAIMSLILTNDPPLVNNNNNNNNNNNSNSNSNSNNIRKLIQYTFSNWQVKHDVITKDNSWQVTDQPMCLSLQGHLTDLQQWLSQQGQIEVCLVLVDKMAKCEHTIGKSMVRLQDRCPLEIQQTSFPIHDRSNRLHVDQSFQFARVVVQLGLVKGWRNYLGDQQMDISLVNSSDSDSLVQQQNHSFLYQL